jgi:hypothetical protein
MQPVQFLGQLNGWAIVLPHSVPFFFFGHQKI